MAEPTHSSYEGAAGRQLRFDFPEPWQALKFDESAWYRNTIKTRVKAMDLVACLDATHWWIEVKDCKGFEADNLPRLSGPADQSAQLLAMYRQLTPEFEPLDVAVEQLELTDRGSWRVQLDSGTTIELGRGTPAEVIERTRSYVRTVPRATANYGRKPDAVESADLRHVSGYAMRLRGVTTVTGDIPKDAPKPRAPIKNTR